MKKVKMVLPLAAIIAGLLAVPAGASPVTLHPHSLFTPGTCVENFANIKKFHENVHAGVPGTEAFTNENNPVSIYRGVTCP